MRKILTTALFALLGLQASLSAGEGWMTDFKAAKAKAVAENKPMLLDFTGSDWCPPCMMMDKEIFSQEVFMNYAEDRLVLVKLDFPRQKEQSSELRRQNQTLAQAYRIEGFPTIMVLSPEGELLERTTGYRRGGAEKYVEYIEQILASAE